MSKISMYDGSPFSASQNFPLHSLTIPNIWELRVNTTSNIDYDEQNMAYSILSFLKVVLISE